MPRAASVPFTRAPREIAESRRVTRKCVFGSVVPEGGGGEDARAATVREAAVPLWAARICGTVRDFRRALRVKARREVVRVADMVDLRVSRGVERIKFV